jgi:hypothetical protein
MRRSAQGISQRARGLGLRAIGTALTLLALSPQPSALSRVLATAQPSALSQAQPSGPIIVSIPKDPPKSELSGLADVLLGSLGLTGVIVIAAVLMGALMAGLMFWVRSRQT